MKKAEKYDELLKKYNIQDSRDLEKVMKVYYQQSENVTAEEVEISEELMVQYGISSMEEFTKARELNVFKENFVHVSESDQSKFDYVKGILERSKNAIFAYLELLVIAECFPCFRLLFRGLFSALSFIFLFFIFFGS